MRKISNILFLLLTLFCTALMTACGDPDITEPTTVLSLSDLPGKSIGVLKDSPADLAASVLEDPASDQAPAVVVRYKKLDDAVKDLKKAKLDCVILDSFSAAQYYMENGKLAVLEDAFSWQEYSICLNNSSSWLQEEINRVLALMDDHLQHRRLPFLGQTAHLCRLNGLPLQHPHPGEPFLGPLQSAGYRHLIDFVHLMPGVQQLLGQGPVIGE